MKARPATANAIPYSMETTKALGKTRKEQVPKNERLQLKTITLSKLQERVDKLTFSTDFFGARISKLDTQIAATRQRIVDAKRQRKWLGGVKASSEVHAKIQKQISLLEDRRNKFTVLDNELSRETAGLKHKVNLLRKEKLIFNSVHQQLERNFKQKQESMTSIIENANFAHDSRTEALRKIQQLKEDNYARKLEHQKEWEKLGLIINEQARMDKYVKSSALKKREREIEKQIEVGGLDPEDEARLRAKLSKLRKKASREAEYIQTSENKIQSFEQAFRKLEKATGLDDVNDIVETFVSDEDENFSIFHYIQDLNGETDLLEEDLIRTTKEMEKFITDEGRNDGRRKKTMREMEVRLNSVREKATQYKRRNKNQSVTLQRLYDSIFTLFSRIGCEHAAPPTISNQSSYKGTRSKVSLASQTKNHQSELLENAVDEQSVMYYLGAVEQRVYEIIQAYIATRFASMQREQRRSTPLEQSLSVRNQLFGAWSNVDKATVGEESDPQSMPNKSSDLNGSSMKLSEIPNLDFSRVPSTKTNIADRTHSSEAYTVQQQGAEVYVISAPETKSVGTESSNYTSSNPSMKYREHNQQLRLKLEASIYSGPKIPARFGNYVHVSIPASDESESNKERNENDSPEFGDISETEENEIQFPLSSTEIRQMVKEQHEQKQRQIVDSSLVAASARGVMGRTASRLTSARTARRDIQGSSNQDIATPTWASSRNTAFTDSNNRNSVFSSPKAS